MKNIVFGVVLGVCLSSPTRAQIAVMDASSIQQQTQAQIETMAKWKIQYDQMINQIDQAKHHYESITGGRGLGEIMNDPALRDYLPTDWQTIYDNVRNSGYAGLNGRAADIYNANKLFDHCAHIKVDDHRRACEAQAVKPSQDKAVALESYDSAKARVHQIDQLMKQINTTQDLKAMAELQARIAVEQANIQNEQTKLQLYTLAAAADDRIQAQRQREIQARTWSVRGGIEPEPLKFR